MAKKYHIKDDGTPGECRAATLESCPKTQAGDGFHGTAAEATAESERRFEANHGAVATSSRSVQSQEALEDQLRAEYRELQALHGREEDALRTASNKAQSAAASKRTRKAYDDFNERTGFKDKVAGFRERAKDLGYRSLGELAAAPTFERRELGNGGMALPPKLKSDQALAYSFDGKKGWLVANPSYLGGESQYFIHQHQGQWVASRIDLDADPLGQSSRVEIRPDNLRTFFREQGTDFFRPTEPLGGRYPLDPADG